MGHSVIIVQTDRCIVSAALEFATKAVVARSSHHCRQVFGPAIAVAAIILQVNDLRLLIVDSSECIFEVVVVRIDRCESRLDGVRLPQFTYLAVCFSRYVNRNVMIISAIIIVGIIHERYAGLEHYFT